MALANKRASTVKTRVRLKKKTEPSVPEPVLAPPSCDLGYTYRDVSKLFGKRWARKFDDYVMGYVQGYCTGKRCTKPGRPHGGVGYPKDVKRFLMGLPMDGEQP